MRITSRWSSIALGLWLILSGLTIFGLSFPYMGVVLAVLAIVAGVLILLGR